MGRPRKRRRADEGLTDASGQPLSNDNRNGVSPPSGYVSGSSQQQRHGSGENGLDMWFEGMGFSGFQGFAFEDAGANGGENGVSADLFELEPNFSLDPLLAGELMGEVGGSGGAAHQQVQHDSSISSHSRCSKHHFFFITFQALTCSTDSPPGQSIAQHPLIAPPGSLSCACLSNIYLTLSSLHTLSSHDFPFILPSLRTAIATANTVLNCPHCPRSYATASQNIHGLISLLMTLIDNVYKLLTTIDAEAQRVDAAGTKKPFVLADASAPAHMHSGSADCPVRFGMELSGTEWRELARKVVKGQIIGNAAEAEAGGAEGTVYGTLAAFVRRQNRWHEDPQILELKKNAIGGELPGMQELGNMRLCVQNVEHVTARMKMLDI